MKICEEPWHLCDDCLEPLAIALHKGGNLRPGLIKLKSLLEEYRFFEGAIPTLQVVVSLECAVDLERRILALRDRLDFVNRKALDYMKLTCDPSLDDLSKDEVNEAAWIFSERYWEWFWKDSDKYYTELRESGDPVIRTTCEGLPSILPEAVKVFGYAYYECFSMAVDLAFFLWQLSAYIKPKVDALTKTDLTGSAADAGPITPAPDNDVNCESTSDQERLATMKPHQKKAYIAGRFAERSLREDATYKEIWDWLKDGGLESIPGLRNYTLPSKNTFQDYYSAARCKMGENRKNRRPNTTSRSVVRPSDL
jgi:hypothetical protein